jgi:hypothetical protein
MDFGKAFTFMFEDPDWLRKLGIGTAVGAVAVLLMPFLIGIIPFMMVIGYTVETLRNVTRGEERPMPEWNDWGLFLSLGFKVLAASFVWALPAILLMIPFVIGSALTNQGQGGEAVGIAILCCASCLLLIWILFVALITPAIYIRIAQTDRFSSAFALGPMWQFTRDNLGNVIVALLLVYVVAGLIAAVIGFVGFLLLVIGAIITIPLATLWQYLVQAHLFGQIAKYSVTPIEGPVQ